MSLCSLNELWEEVDYINKTNFPDNGLKPIVGNGKIQNPKFMFVFINPTHVNISSSPNWQGPRFPFIGTKPVWRIFHKAGMLNNELIEQINSSNDWSLEFTGSVLDFLKVKSYYFTNIVKWTGKDATLPNSHKIKLFLPVLQKEIQIVQPKYVVTFGLIPFQNLTGLKIKLNDYYSEVMEKQKLRFYNLDNNINTKVIPCYFPIGRGNPKRAVELLKMINDL